MLATAAPSPRARRVRAATAPRRALVIDCETTGLSPETGDRMVSFAAIELAGLEPTGRHIHHFFSPGRPSHPRAFEAHGLSDAFLAGQRAFAEQAGAILAFLGIDPLIGHNIDFDLRFLATELRRAGLPIAHGAPTCTLTLFRRRYPGRRASLDQCCAALGIDREARASHHGALIDARLTARVYAALAPKRR